MSLAMRTRASGCLVRTLWKFALIVCACLLAGGSALGQQDAPDFGAGVVWLDGPAHHIADYRGKVLLVDFWEYTCINCIRDFAVVKKWYAVYHPYGFDVVGVHFGEFEVSSQEANIRKGAAQFQLPWPIVADLKGTTWKAYNAQGWPMRYLINPQGKIVMQVFGETDNNAMEARIRELLAVAHPEVMKLPMSDADNAFKPSCGVTTQETFAGELQGRSAIDDLDGHRAGETADFLPHHSPADGKEMLMGRWKIEADGVTSAAPGASAEVRFHARSTYAVMNTTGKPIRVNLFEDGATVAKESAGRDVQFDARGAFILVDQARMYYLLRSPAFGGHLLSLEAEAPGLTLHTFAYGNNCQLDDQP